MPLSLEGEASLTGGLTLTQIAPGTRVSAADAGQQLEPHALVAPDPANNAEIDAVCHTWQKKLEPLREALNAALKTAWEEWQMPREADAKWSEDQRAAR